MTTKFTSSLFILMLLIGINFSKAQLAGPYTIGGTTPNYATITDAITDLNAQGISAPVVFNIRDGVYAGKLALTAVTGATFTNTVTFQSENADSTLVTITAPSSISGLNNYTVQLSGADYIIFKQVTIERSGALATSRVIDIGGGSDYNSFANCIITNGTIAGSNNLNALVHSAVGTTDNYNAFSNNSFINGSYGFYFFGGTTSLIENGNMIDNNLFVGQSAFAIQSGNQADFMVSGNIITGNTATYNTAIYLANCNNNSMALENKVVLTDGGTGILVQQCNGGAGEVVVANNFVTVNTLVNTANSQAFGIKLISCSNTGIYFNNVLNLADFTAASCFAFQATGAGINVNVYNNIFDAAFSYVIGVTNTAVTQMNYNDLYSYGFFFGQFNGTTNLADFTAWQAGTPYDANSVSADPLFVSNTDLHIQTFALNANAIPAGNILIDIDGSVRDVTTPDIGADETTPPSNDVGVVKLLTPLTGTCGSSTTVVAAIVKNYAALPQTNITVTAEITGTQTITLTGIITDTIDVYKSDTVFFTPAINTYLGDSLIIKMYTTILNDEDLTNDTLEVDSVYINAIPAPPVVPATVNSCINNPVSIPATLLVNQQVYWFSIPSGGIPIQTGSPLVVTPTSNTTYYAEVRDTLSVGGSIADSLSTPNAPNNGSGAVFFNVTNNSLTDVTIHYLSTLISGNNLASVYYLPGGLTSCTTNPVIANFTLSGSILVNGLGGAGNPYTIVPINMNVTIPPSQTYAFCISSTTINYTNGTNTGTCPVIASDAMISIHEGFGGTAASPIANRRMNGTVSYSVSQGCPSDRVSVEIKVSQPPVVNLGNDTIIALPNTLPLDAGTGFLSYLWSTGATTQNITVTASGTYTVTVTDAVGCTGSDAILVTVLTGINDFGANSSIMISPVPAKNYLKVNLQNLTAGDYKISLLNNLGQPALTSNLNVQSTNAEKVFDLGSFPKGVYYVEVRSDKGIYHQRVLVQ